MADTRITAAPKGDTKKANRGLWIMVSVEYFNHPKIVRACKLGKSGSDPATLNLAAIAYAKKHRTPGRLPDSAIHGLAAPVRRPKQAAAALVAAGVWHQDGDDYVIHDFSDWNDSPEAQEQQRERARLEKQAQRDRKREEAGVRAGHPPGQDTGHETGHGTGQHKDNSHVSEWTSHAPARSAHSASVSPSGSDDLGEGGVGETAPDFAGGAWRQRSHRGGLTPPIAAHMKCYQSEACAVGLCVPGFLGAQWQAQLSGDTRAVVAFISEALEHVNGPVGDDPLPWWRAQWKAKHGSVTTGRQNTRAADVDANNRDVIDRVIGGRS